MAPSRRLRLGDELSMDVHLLSHDSREGPIRDVMYVSRGLGPKEIALDVRLREHEPHESFDVEIGHLFLQFHALARAGRTVDVGSVTTLADESRPFLGRPDFRAIVYTFPDAEARALLGGEGLLGIFVTGLEADLARQVGHLRLLGQLGNRSRYYPTPPWSDRDRPEVLTPDFAAKSLLRGAPRVSVLRSAAWTEFSGPSKPVAGPLAAPDFESELGFTTVHARFDRDALGVIGDAFLQVPPAQPLVFLTGFDPDIPRCLTWVPGQAGGNAISDFRRGNDRRCLGNFLLVVPEQPRNQVRVIEDGFGLSLRTPDWEHVRAEVAAGRPVSVADDEGHLVLEISIEAD
jgi:hypothetical protein